MMQHTIHTLSPEETIRFGHDLGKSLSGPSTILLIGGMGMGKTQMTRGIVAGMGIEDDISSPTYTLVNEYTDGDKAVYHFDLYRLGDMEELYEMGFEDYLNAGSTLIIEWPEIAADYPFDNPVLVRLEPAPEGDNARVITLESDDDACITQMKALGW